MEDCSICYESITASTGHCTLGCAHTFHTACIGRWTSQSTPSCPLCRKELGDTERIVKPFVEIPDLPELDTLSQVPSQSFINMIPRRMMFTVRTGRTSILDNLNDLIHMTEVPIRIGNGITISEADIRIVMERAEVSRSLAVRTLRENEGNVSEALYELDHTEPDEEEFVPPQNPLEPTDDMFTAWALERLFSKGTIVEKHDVGRLESVRYRTSEVFRYGCWMNPEYRDIPKKRRADSL
jgi:hypothetical protein